MIEAMLIALFATLLIAQQFDVASVRPNHTAGCRGRWDFNASRGQVTAENAPLMRIISRAFNLTDDRISGPSWLDSECYDIRAKAAGGVSDRDLMPMLQALLRERFHLVARLVSEERPVFNLVVDKGGAKIHPYGNGIEVPQSTNDARVLFMVRHMPDLCERLGKVTGRPVIDKTGLDGDYMIVLNYLPLGAVNNDPGDPAADIVSAVREQLGLRLEAARSPVEVLKIESLDRIPAGN